MAGFLSRALSIRMAYALAKLHMRIDPCQAHEDAMFYATLDAEQYGYEDYRRGLHTAPRLFQNEPALRTAWQRGWDFAEECAALATCAACRAASGDPCTIHG